MSHFRMKFQIFLAYIFLLPGIDLASVFAVEKPDSHSRPNFIILLADDLGYGELGCQGNPQIPTPHIDSIAQEGVRFTNGYVSASYCSPSRAGLMTGRYQSRFGYETNPVGAVNEDPNVGLPRMEVTLADRLKAAGYRTSLVGKWHLGGTAYYHPQRRGFEEFFGFLHEGHYFVPPPYDDVTTMLRVKKLPNGTSGRAKFGNRVFSTHMNHAEPAYDTNNPILRSSQPVVENEYLTDAFTREACEFIERSKEQPFFLYVAYNAVHSPLQATDTSMQKFASIEDVHRRIFAGMLSNLDESVGQILRKIEEENLAENTVVVFLSDNGGPTKELTSSNLPLRGFKGDMYEGGIRVPFLMQWPGVTARGEEYAAPVISLDLVPTFVRAAGLEINDRETDGVDLRPYLTKEKSGDPHNVLFWRQKQRAALRMGDWKIVNHSLNDNKSQWELFDLANDISETKDLAEENPDDLNKALQYWKTLAGKMP
ncbi:sulfatase [Rubinisphaera sp.]|mgnify:CR=1 FL=1|uniref:sulfatase n=2 Tax=Rubinisphaera TaxID=1649490 RepID=UPI0025D9B1B5|nr:sulfatase [Rubinisphaera sp.]